MHEETIARAAEIIGQITPPEGYCVLSLIDLDGCPTASTITPSKAGGIQWITFCTGFGTRTERIQKCNKACVCFNSPEYNITLKGTIEILTDQDTKSEMWYDGMGNHFSGPDDPGYCVLRFQTESYNLLVDWNEARGTL